MQRSPSFFLTKKTGDATGEVLLQILPAAISFWRCSSLALDSPGERGIPFAGLGRGRPSLKLIAQSYSLCGGSSFAPSFENTHLNWLSSAGRVSSIVTASLASSFLCPKVTFNGFQSISGFALF